MENHSMELDRSHFADFWAQAPCRTHRPKKNGQRSHPCQPIVGVISSSTTKGERGGRKGRRRGQAAPHAMGSASSREQTTVIGKTGEKVASQGERFKRQNHGQKCFGLNSETSTSNYLLGPFWWVVNPS